MPFPAQAPGDDACVPAPPGCDISSLCDCELRDGDWEGQPITGCSILGERSLYVTDVTCGSRRCTPNEVCLARSDDQSFVPLPEGCNVSMDFCDTDCADEVARQAGATQANGCMSADWAVAVTLDAPSG
jgi:hypothetical protein